MLAVFETVKSQFRAALARGTGRLAIALLCAAVVLLVVIAVQWSGALRDVAARDAAYAQLKADTADDAALVESLSAERVRLEKEKAALEAEKGRLESAVEELTATNGDLSKKLSVYDRPS
ncbi:MAG: hypothetical protein LBR00_00760 [Clostridiales Family XIII bacterium]|jgi:septal ring factor EnvC (AmiA/AmiB activator)|nr:hypothetical protein [Clostridiales Family XIII bacterium]